MAYEESTEPGAAEELEAEPVDTGGKDTFFLDADFPGRENYKPGDTIPLRVVGEDPEGRLEVECVHDEKSKDWKQDMRDTMGPELDGKGAI